MAAALNWLHQRRKAIAGGLVAGLSVYIADRSNGMTADEWWQVIGATLVAAGVVHTVPNRKATP